LIKWLCKILNNPKIDGFMMYVHDPLIKKVELKMICKVFLT